MAAEVPALDPAAILGASEERRREELADFLRKRRALLKPEDVGLPSGSRRRTPGLRREEVAHLAGVGTTWYTWLEQGRDVRASLDVLEAISRALRLTPAERTHLVLLGRGEVPPPCKSDERVSPTVKRIIENLGAQPGLHHRPPLGLSGVESCRVRDPRRPRCRLTPGPQPPVDALHGPRATRDVP